jgi:hypothetical protein
MLEAEGARADDPACARGEQREHDIEGRRVPLARGRSGDLEALAGAIGDCFRTVWVTLKPLSGVDGGVRLIDSRWTPAPATPAS